MGGVPSPPIEIGARGPAAAGRPPPTDLVDNGPLFSVICPRRGAGGGTPPSPEFDRRTGDDRHWPHIGNVRLRGPNPCRDLMWLSGDFEWWDGEFDSPLPVILNGFQKPTHIKGTPTLTPERPSPSRF